MYTNFRETLYEQLRNPEFAAAWKESAASRKVRWQVLFAEGLQQALDSGFDGLKAQARAEDYADGSIDAREFFTFNMLELGYNLEEIADMVELPLEWVQALAKADRSKILNALSLNEFLDDPETYIDTIKNSMRPTLIRESDGNEVVALGWEQYQNLLCETDALESLQTQCDFKNCRLWADGRCTDTNEREKCPLIAARSELQSLHYELQKFKDKDKKIVNLICQLRVQKMVKLIWRATGGVHETSALVQMPMHADEDWIKSMFPAVLRVEYSQNCRWEIYD